MGGGCTKKILAPLNTMGPLELAGVQGEESICRVIFPLVKLARSKNSDSNKILEVFGGLNTTLKGEGGLP